jgi:hypothetical protein
VRGHLGLNRVRFSGRLRNGRLAAGVYTIAIVAVRGRARSNLGTVGIEVVSRGRRLTKAERTAPVFAASCATRPGAGLTALVLPLGRAGGASRSSPAGSKPAPRPRGGGVLGAEILPRISIPRPAIGHGPFAAVLAALVLGLLGLASAVLLVYLTRFFKGSWNP